MEAIECDMNVNLRRSPVRLVESAGCSAIAVWPRLLARSKAKWGDVDTVDVDALGLRSPEERCAVTGLLYKPQRLKPSSFRKPLRSLVPRRCDDASSSSSSSMECLFLEGEYVRVKLTGNCPDIRELVTGLPCAVLGFPSDSGVFKVTDYCFPSYRSREEHGVPRADDGKILFVSGLNFSASAGSLGLNLLGEWITGMVGNSEAQKTQASVVCTIIAGNSVRGSLESGMQKGCLGTETRDEGTVFKESARAARKLDDFLRSILTTCSVLLMPGEFDPVSHFLPQQPFHPCVLPSSSSYETFHGGTNPWSGRINERLIAGSSGQPLANIMKIDGLLDRSPIHWLEKTLEWGFYVPTAPTDLSPGFSSPKNNPFLMDECPEVYFAGNMANFETKLYSEAGQETRLICIPSFAETQTAILLDLRDLSCQTISFG